MWKVIFTKKADKEFAKLSSEVRKIIAKAIDQKLLIDPNRFLIPLIGDLSGFCKFRIGDYRLICKKEEEILLITVIKVKHRKEVYKIN
jgi:mRNA interferase RelE/StbE